MRLFSVVLVGFLSLAGAFSPSPRSSLKALAPHSLPSKITMARFSSLHDANNDDNSNNYDLSSSFVTKAAPISLATWLAFVGSANAAGPDWGIFEGRTGSILHPLTMGGLFGLSLYTAFLGFQWRRQRTLGDEIAALKQKMPNLGSFKTIQEALDSGEMENQEASLKAALPIEQEISSLTSERKDLASQGNRDKHYNQGAWIAFFGTVFAIEVRVEDILYRRLS